MTVSIRFLAQGFSPFLRKPLLVSARAKARRRG
jgi:hypothetical protein